MKKGQQFLCGHGSDERGTPYGECPMCQEDTRRKIDAWLASKEVQDKINKGECPF